MRAAPMGGTSTTVARKTTKQIAVNVLSFGRSATKKITSRPDANVGPHNASSENLSDLPPTNVPNSSDGVARPHSGH